MHLNRVVAALTALCGLVGAIAVPLANLDTSSVVGVVGGLGVIATAAYKWLDGWQKHEARHAIQTAVTVAVNSNAVDSDELPHIPVHPGNVPVDEGDKGSV